MLQTIRDRAQGWLAWVIVILISVPFALWGIQSYFDVGGVPIAATVNGVEIPARDLDRRVEQARMELRERLGAAYDPAEFDDRQLRAEVLDALVREVLLLDVVRDLGLRIADQDVQIQVLSDPSFQQDGRFDKETYERLLQYQGMTPGMYEAQLRQQMAAGQLIRAVSTSELATTSELNDYQRLMEQRRELSYLRFPVAEYRTDAPLDEAAISAFYEAHPAQFQSPEQVKIDYLVLDTDALASKTESTESDLRSIYETDQARFAQPERRHVRHILLKAPDDGAAQAVLDEIEGIRERLLAGASFDELAKTHSQDPGSGAAGGSLGVIESGIMVPPFDQAAFALAQGQISEPVRTQFGYHLIEVTEIFPAQIKPFEDVREQLETESSKQRADALYYDLGERLASITYESPDSLIPAAEELGLVLQQSDWIGRSGGEGVLAHPKVVAAAFSDEIRLEGRNSDMIEPERDRLQAVVLRVAEHRDATLQPLSEVRDEIVAEIKQEKAKADAAAAAESSVEKLRQSSDWAAVSETLKPETPGLVDRRASEVPAAVLDTAFRLPAPAQGAFSVATATLDNGDSAVVRIARVEDGEVETREAGQPAPESIMLTQIMGRQAYENMLKDMERRADIKKRAVVTDDPL